MSTLMIIVGSVRPGRVGLPVAEWVRDEAAGRGGFDIDFVDLAELALPFMDEPNHPSLGQYTKPHTLRWSERVAAADAFVFVTPEYNHSYSPVLKNAFDYLNKEWWRKAVAFVSYGGVSGGSRGVAAFDIVIGTVGLTKTAINVEIPFVKNFIVDERFVPTEKETAVLRRMLDEVVSLTDALAPLR